MTKKLVILVAVLFVGFWLFTDPTGLANVSKQAGGAGASGVSALFTAIIDFIRDLV